MMMKLTAPGFAGPVRYVWLILLSLLCGCPNQGLLIQPVSTRRDLTESEILKDDGPARDKIVLVDVSGVLMNASRWEFLGKGEQPVSLLLEQLDKARKDAAVKAVLLRINSPGGSVVASELMHQEITHFRKTSGKPVVAVMMDVAASGGYYLACACDEIIAQPSSVTGSIGVLMQMFDLSGTMGKIGVRADAIASGPRKDAGSPLRALTPEERALFQNMVNDMYERFIAVVVAGRPNLDERTIRSLADGRVYTAAQALEAGLIDRVAPMREAVERSKAKAGVKRARLVTYHRPLDYKPNYYAHAPNPPSGDINLIHLDASSLINQSAPRFMYLWQPGH